jgi:uncharacterized protein DUF4403
MNTFSQSLRATTLLLLTSASSTAFAADKPAFNPDQPASATAPSKMSATVQFSLATLDRALERKVPRRLASIEDRGSECWHRRILGREVDIDCAYSGSVERVAPILLHAEHGRLVAAAPLFGSVSGQGIGRFARLLHGSAEGQMTVYASARPRLNRDWSVSLDMSEGFRWQEPPVLTILGFRIDMARYVTPKIEAQLARVRGDVEASVRELDIKGKAEAAWRQAFANVKISDQPQIWLQATPQSVAFAGLHAEGDVLEGAIEIAGTTTTSIGSEPAPKGPTPLPQLGSDVSDPGRFEIIVPVAIDYDAIKRKVQDILAGQSEANFSAQEIEIYPSSGNLVMGIRAGKPQSDGGDWVYLTATPQVDAATGLLRFPDLAVVTDAEAATQGVFGTSGMLQALREQLSVGFRDDFDRIVASANAKLTRPLGDGFRSEGKLTSAGIADVRLLSDRIQIDLRADGRLKLIYGG